MWYPSRSGISFCRHPSMWTLVVLHSLAMFTHANTPIRLEGRLVPRFDRFGYSPPQIG